MIRNQRAWSMRIWAITVVIVMAVPPLGGVSAPWAQAAEESGISPANPDFVEFWQQPPEPFYGYIPPPMDLSHLDGIPGERARGLANLPGSFDWRDQGKVTPVKDQNPCGTCWVYGTLAAVESKVLIEESTSYDFSEQNLDCCTDPAWVYLVDNRCMGGGWSWLAADTLTKKGTRLEACQPYNTTTIDTEACDDSCESIKMVTDYRIIADKATSPDMIGAVKSAVYNGGPLAMSYRQDASHLYPGNIYYWPDCTLPANHLVCLIGWDDGIEWPDESGSGAWIIKNSWGTSWGDSGYFYLCYGSANMREVASFDYKDYDPNEKLYYWDEAGEVASLGNWHDYSGWMANVFTSSQDGSLTHVDFWTTGNDAQYEIYVYLDGDISDGLQNQATSQSGTCQEFGYYSIPLGEPLSLTRGQQFAIAVKMTTPGYRYPIPVECKETSGGETIVDPPIQSGRSFYRHGDGESWSDTAALGCNACLRGRVTNGAGQPEITVNPASYKVTLEPGTSENCTLNIGNAGDEPLFYSISDREETGPPAAGGMEDCPWLDESPTSGSVGPGEPADSITVTIDSTGLAGGNYSAEILVSSNDPERPEVAVPVALHVSGGTLELYAGVNIISYPGATATLAQALTNIGPGDLDVAVIIWARTTWTLGQWWFYNVAQDYAWPAEFTHLENGKAYLIVVSEDCSWELL